MTEKSYTRFSALNFRRDIKRLTEDFTGREWLFEEIDNWLHHTDQRFFILTGEPGVGKSSIAARLTEVRPKNIAAHHFCIAGSVGTITPNSVLRSLVTQLCESLPKYGDALVNTIKPHQVSIVVKQEIGRIEAGARAVGVVINHLVASNPEEELDILLRAPLTTLEPPNTPIFILIDALDEAMTYQGQFNLIHLLAKCNDLPEWVRFVCTTRPEQVVLSYFNRFDPFILTAESPENLADNDQYIAYRVRKAAMQSQLQAANIATQTLTKHVAELANGNFLYTKVLLDDIEVGRQSLDNLAALPRSLYDMYHSFLRRFSDEDWDEHFQPILGKLAVVQEPITEEQLANFTTIRRHQVRRSLAVVGQYLNEGKDGQGNKTYRLFHESLRDYLLDEEISSLYWCDPEEEHKIIAEFYTKNYQGKWSTSDLYCLRHLPTHLAGANQNQALREILLDFDWLQTKLDVTDFIAVMVDYNITPDDEVLYLVRKSLGLSSHVLTEDKTQLASQLLGRLLGRNEPDIHVLLQEAARSKTYPWLRPHTACLIPPGGPLLHTLANHDSVVTCVAVTPDGRCAISGSRDNTLKVWDLGKGVELLTLRGHIGRVEGLTLTPDGHKAVSLSEDDKALKVWDLESGAELNTLAYHKGVRAVTVMPDGCRVISASDDDGMLKVWDLETGLELLTLSSQTRGVDAVAAMPDGRHFVSASFSKLMVWNLDTGQIVQTINRSYQSILSAVAVTPDGTRAVSAAWDGLLDVWNLRTGDRLLILRGHSTKVNSVVVTADGSRAISGSDDMTLKIWDLESGRELRTLTGHTGSVESVAVTPDGRYAVSASDDGTIKVWDLRMDDEPDELPNHTGSVTGVAMIPDKSRAISASYDGTLKIWDLETCQEVCVLRGHSDRVRRVAVTPDGTRAISASHDQTLKVWDLETGDELLTLYGHSDEVSSVASMRDEHRAVSGSNDYTLRVWDLDTGDNLLAVAGHDSWIWGVAVTPDGQRAVSAHVDGAIVVWDLKTGEAIQGFVGHIFTINDVIMMPDEQHYITASDDETLKVWSLETDVRLLTTLSGHSGPVRGVALTPDGYHAVSASGDRTLRVWNLESGQPIATFTGDETLCCCAVANDGRTIIAGGGYGTVYFLSLEIPGKQ